MDDLAEIRKRVEIINEEVGEVCQRVASMEGELRWIRWILMGVLAAAIGQFLVP